MDMNTLTLVVIVGCITQMAIIGYMQMQLEKMTIMMKFWQGKYQLLSRYNHIELDEERNHD